MPLGYPERELSDAHPRPELSLRTYPFTISRTAVNLGFLMPAVSICSVVSGSGAGISQQIQSVADHVKSLSGYMMLQSQLLLKLLEGHRTERRTCRRSGKAVV